MVVFWPNTLLIPCKEMQRKNRCNQVDKRKITAKQEKEMLASFILRFRFYYDLDFG
jgi:hypothetical protein